MGKTILLTPKMGVFSMDIWNISELNNATHSVALILPYQDKARVFSTQRGFGDLDIPTPFYIRSSICLRYRWGVRYEKGYFRNRSYQS